MSVVDCRWKQDCGTIRQKVGGNCHGPAPPTLWFTPETLQTLPQPSIAAPGTCSVVTGSLADAA